MYGPQFHFPVFQSVLMLFTKNYPYYSPCFSKLQLAIFGAFFFGTQDRPETITWRHHQKELPLVLLKWF